MQPGRAIGGPAYAPDAAAVAQGTRDKLFIRGHFYSDKSPVPALFMAGIYQTLQWTTGLVARNDAARFCYLLTLLSSGLAYVIAVVCIDRLAAAPEPMTRWLVTGSFALATVALTYARQVNNHILLLAVASTLLLLIRSRTRSALVAAGALIGVGYTIDLGLGPVLVLSVMGLVLWQTRSLRALALLLASAFPWFALHHYLNWQIGGTFSPANAQAAYLAWPGSPFGVANMTGAYAHKTFGHFLLYALDLLFGKRGFLGHNLALFLALPGAVWLLRRRVPETPEITWALVFFGGGWLIYALTSNNYSGACVSIRWYVPLLAPGYYCLILLLRHAPQYRNDLAILTAFGLALGLSMWWEGPWMQHMIPGYWFIQGATALCWLGWRFSPRKS